MIIYVSFYMYFQSEIILIFSQIISVSLVKAGLIWLTLFHQILESFYMTKDTVLLTLLEGSNKFPTLRSQSIQNLKMCFLLLILFSLQLHG